MAPPSNEPASNTRASNEPMPNEPTSRTTEPAKNSGDNSAVMNRISNGNTVTAAIAYDNATSSASNVQSTPNNAPTDSDHLPASSITQHLRIATDEEYNDLGFGAFSNESNEELNHGS